MSANKKDPRIPWVALNMMQSLDPGAANRLVGHFGSAEAVWAAAGDMGGELDRCPHITQQGRARLAEAKKNYPGAAINEIKKAADFGADIFAPESKGYPQPLLDTQAPPPALYTKGKVSPEDAQAVAIVGTRKCTAYGRDMAFELAHDLARHGVTVVSGLAHGIDTAAHRGALQAGGRTLAVLGTGIDIVYPAINRGLADEVAEAGALVSEFPMGTGPEKWNFPRRNRVISGLCLGVAVVEAPEDSGALITVTSALEQGREVFAVPGNVKSWLNRGAHRLIREGACLVESAEDILNEICAKPRQPELAFEPELAGKEKELFEIISVEPLNFDEICRQAGYAAAEAAAALTMLEMKNLVRQLPGRMFVRRA